MKTSRLVVLVAVATSALLLLLGVLSSKHAQRISGSAPMPAVVRSPHGPIAPETTADDTRPTMPATPVPATEAQACYEIAAWTLPPPNTSPLAPGETFASRQVRAIGQVKSGSLSPLATLRPGQRLLLPVRLGPPLEGVVNLVVPDDEGWVRVGGALQDGTKGNFSLSQRGTQWRGMIRNTTTQTAWVLQTDAQNEIQLIEKPLSSVQCLAIPSRTPPDGAAAAEGPSGNVSVNATSTGPVVPPDLDSLPTATHVIYLDFDGEDVTDPDWNNGFAIHALPAKLGSAYITTAAMTEIWKRVAEDYKPFNIAVTTKLSRYTAAGAGKRMRCIITQTDVAEPGAGGVAFVGSYDEAGTSFSSTIPCWAFTETYYSPRDIADTVSHEVGHTLGLSHDGLYPDSDSRHVEYYDGHGSGATSWTPIMGGGYGYSVSQWSKGEYSPHASNTEDDLAIIANGINGFGRRTDDAANAAPGTQLPNTGTFDHVGIISSASDTDLYAFDTVGGSVTINAASASVGPNLDILLELRDADGTTVLKSSNPAGPAKATLTHTVGAGTFFIAVRSSGYGTASTGYTTYGSIGEYTITGTFPAVPDAAPTVTLHPLSQAVPLGTKVTFTVAATSNTAPTYQWTKDGVNLAGQTKSTLVITSAQPANQGVYRCLVTNTIGSTPSDPATLTVNYKPVFTLHPTTRSTNAGSPVSFSVAAHGTPTVSFQWQRNAVNIPGATNPTLTLNDPQWADAGSYRCVASNAFGSTTSSAASLTVTSAPVILAQPPATHLAPLNGSTSFSVTAAGTGTLTYQWFKDGSTKLTGKTSRTLTLTGINATTAGSYHCEVKNALGTTASSACVVTVQDTPVITRDLTNLTVARGKAVTLAVTAVGSPTLKYEWRKNGVKVPGTAASLSIVATADADYDVTVSNIFGSTTSATAHITVHDVPKITTQPLSQIRAYGGDVTFTVVATGTAPFTYQWKKNNVPIAGQTADSLHLTNLTAGDAASYSCTVTNDVGSATSTAAKLALQTAPSIATQPVSQTIDEFGTVTFTGTATGTATLKYQWQKFDPTLAAYVDIPLATTASYKIPSVQAAHAGDYRLKVTNTVGTALSNTATLTVNPVAPPVLSGFTPPIGKAGHYVRLLGSNLNWTQKVMFRSATGAIVNAAFVIVSRNELLVTVPSGASSAPIEVLTRGGGVTTGSSFFVTTANDTNNDFANARVIPPGGAKLSGNNALFSSEIGEPSHALDPSYPSDYAPQYSAWFQWTPTVSGSYYISTAGSAFDTRVGVYTGTSVGALTAVAFNDDQDWDNNVFTSRAYLVAHAGTTYYIAVDGFNYLVEDPFFGDYFYDERGAYSVNITRIAATTVIASSGKKRWITEGASGQASDGAVVVGQPAQPSAALAWLSRDATALAPVVRTQATVSYEAPAGTTDQLGLVAYDVQEEPMFGLSISAQTGEITRLDANGEPVPTGQTLVPSKDYEFIFEIDRAGHTWGAMLNGVWICRDLPLQGTAEFADFAAQSVPVDPAGPRATLTVRTAEMLTGEQAP